MNEFTVSLKKEVYALLDELDKREESILVKAQQGIVLLEDAMKRMKVFIKGYAFRDEYEEIIFFKDIKPRLSCLLIFYRSIYLIEINRPQGGRQAQTAYLKGELDKLSGYFEENKYYYHYYRSGDCSMDRLYFLRGKPSLYIHTDNFYYERDPLFSANCDFKVAEILANDLLESHLVVEIDKIEGRERNGGTDGYNDPPKVKLTWTAKKIDLMETIYDHYCVGSFNNGNASLEVITSYFEAVFNIDLSHTAERAWYDLTNRENPTGYLDRMRKAFYKRIAERETKNHKNKK